MNVIKYSKTLFILTLISILKQITPTGNLAIQAFKFNSYSTHSQTPNLFTFDNIKSIDNTSTSDKITKIKILQSTTYSDNSIHSYDYPKVQIKENEGDLAKLDQIKGSKTLYMPNIFIKFLYIDTNTFKGKESVEEKFFVYINNVSFEGNWKSERIIDTFDYNFGSLDFKFVISNPKIELTSKILDGGYIDKWIEFKKSSSYVVSTINYITKTFSITNISVGLNKGELNDKIDLERSNYINCINYKVVHLISLMVALNLMMKRRP